MSLVGVRPDHDTSRPTGAAAALRTTTAIRERAQYLLNRARAGDSLWFSVDDDSLPAAAAEVADVTRARYPDLHIPYHSRWRHFEAGGVDRKAVLDSRLAAEDAPTRARAMIDLAVVSVLLDAGAGPDWHYLEATTGQRFSRSEGLGVASWHAFCGGVFSGDAAHPLQVDAVGLRNLSVERLAEVFQCAPANPLVGLEGRVMVLRRLGDALASQPEVFGSARPARPPLRPEGARTESPHMTSCRRSWLHCRRSGWRPTGLGTRRSATAGATTQCRGPVSPTAGCRSTSCRSG